MTEQQIDSILSAKRDFDFASRRQMGVNTCRERLKNVLFNASNDLIPMIKGERNNLGVDKAQHELEIAKLNHKIKELEMSVDSLQQALDDSDSENNELRSRLNQLTAKRGKPKKTKVVDSNAEDQAVGD